MISTSGNLIRPEQLRAMAKPTVSASTMEQLASSKNIDCVRDIQDAIDAVKYTFNSWPEDNMPPALSELLEQVLDIKDKLLEANQGYQPLLLHCAALSLCALQSSL
jgi:hypothetical protein